MLKSKIRQIFNSCKDNNIVLIAWIIFIIFTVGFWHFQQYLIESHFNPCKTPVFILLGFLIIVCLLPYVIYKKFKISIHYLSLIFYPSIAFMAIIAQDDFNYICAITTILFSIIFVVFIVRQPKLHTQPLISNLYIAICLLLYCYIASNTNELTHYKYKINHYIEANKYDKALNVGKSSLNINSEVFNLRTKAMLLNNSLGNNLFLYPIAKGTDSIKVDYNLDTHRKQDAILCNLLLQKNLPAFANLISKTYDIKSPNLPKYYKEALVLYLAKTIDTDLNYHSTTIETNYNDFITEMKKYSNINVRSNACRDLYSDTYFWYYFFSNSNSEI